MSAQALQFPCIIFKSQKQMNDHLADDMRYGDLTETQLKTLFGLRVVSTRVDPYTQKKRIVNPDGRLAGEMLKEDWETVSKDECARILFEEFRSNSHTLVWPLGTYSDLIREMIDHMRYKNGTPYRHHLLDQALKEQIVSDTDEENSSLLLIKKLILTNIDWDKKVLLDSFTSSFSKLIQRKTLPKFKRYWDTFNGLGITVHDIHAVHIILKTLRIDGERYYATIHYKAQDHFGIDKTDIMDWRFHQFAFFQIWFVLQRYNKFGYKPFLTNMEATIEISGGRYDK